MKAISNEVSGPLGAALQGCRRHFVSAAVFSALLNLLFIAPMLYMLQVYDRVVPTQGTVTLVFLTLVLVGALATLSLLDYTRSRLLVRASVRLDRQLAGGILDTTLARPEAGGQKISKQVLREFDTLRQTLTGPGILALFDAPWSVIYVLLCFVIHPWLGVLAGVSAAILIFIAWRNEKATRDPLQRANEAAGKAYASHESAAAASDVVRALGMRKAMVRRHLNEREQMMTLQTEASFASSGWTALSKFLRQLLQSLALGLGAFLAISEEISPGAIFASMFLVGRALAPIDQLLGAWKSIIQARGAYKTISELFSQSPPAIPLTQLPPPQGYLTVEQLTVLNAAKDGAIIGNVSFAVRPGEVIGIIGPSGAGKSTLVRMLAGASLPDRGVIRFDGADQNDWDSERLAQFIGYIPQEASLFAGSIKENIARFKNDLSRTQMEIDAAVVEAAQMAGAHHLILRLPGGYDYLLGWGGRGLSAGQAQRNALARAVFGSPKYLILDEPNSHLDTEGDLQLVKTLGELKKGGTTMLIVAHKMSILPVLDKLLVLKEGRLELYGPREEVLSRIAPAQGPRAVPPSGEKKVAQ